MARPAILSPYPIPEAFRGRKVANLGDGFILRAIERHLSTNFDGQTISPRVKPSIDDLDRLQKARIVILGGANQLNDNYTIWPKLSAPELLELNIVCIPFGIGLHGEAGKNDRMSEQTRLIMRAVHREIPYSSWRCPNTLSYLKRELPELSEQMLMTGCPVIYDEPVLTGMKFGHRRRRVAVTATERGDFLSRETATLRAIASAYPKAERLLIVHQNYSPPRRAEWLRQRLRRGPHSDPVVELRAIARRHGYRIIVPHDADEALRIYQSVDFHAGSRLHAHLLCLSLAKRSALIAVDGRAQGMAEHFAFPQCAPDTLEHALEMDFEPVRERIIKTYDTMKLFVKSVETLCSS